MTYEAICDIILFSFLAFIHFSILLICIVWRVKKYHYGLHHSVFGFSFLVISLFVGIFLPLGGFTVLDEGTSGTKALIAGVIICPFLLFFAFRDICFCIYIDGNYIVKRSFLHETRIDLTKPDTVIDDSKPLSTWLDVTISSDKNKIIRFKGRRIEGELLQFLKQCQKIKKGK